MADTAPDPRTHNVGVTDVMLAVNAGRIDSASFSHESVEALVAFRDRYKYALDEVLTKIRILREEFDNGICHSPIMHVKHRLKSYDSLIAKMQRLDCLYDLTAAAAVVRDIAGVRITCPYVADVYDICNILQRQPDLELLQIKDYIATPKPNGYRSLHLIVSVPVFLARQTLHLPVEIQIRTIAMDFWASVEHEIRYKYQATIPPHVERTLLDVAATATALDAQMAALRDEVQNCQSPATAVDASPPPSLGHNR
ncbi:GTP pyrophosphokinase [Dermatophilus congolensis]|uniref:GTP pyrophosphokinase ywaC n=1 Tax=Dermatophilus congolensis TaxID=1863 RepID=A0A239VMH9_9MICO|nr:GTP pyrophosphokinase family protein [Dermatophilus congolensis]SNV22933.1 GTP pyrophosphokinase ywaC [Dermatophilus congolensis]